MSNCVYPVFEIVKGGRIVSLFRLGMLSELFWIWFLFAWHMQVENGSSQAETLTVTRSVPNPSRPENLNPDPKLRVPDQPTESDIKQIRLFAEPLLAVGKRPSPEQNKEVTAVLEAYSNRIVADDFSSIENFVSAYPDSPWTPCLLFNMGLEYYRTGWYSKAFGAWERAWPLLSSSADRDIKAIADQTVGELALMYARVGRMNELSVLLDSIKGRVLLGPGRGKIGSAQQALWTMRHKPEIAFRCGPLALDRIIDFNHPDKGGQVPVQDSGSSTNGFCLSQIAKLSDKAGLHYQMAYRTKGSEFLTPAVVHWKVGHYAALLKEKNGLYLLQDPTFRNDAWLSARALDEETTGYFLVSPGRLPAGWRRVSEAEGMKVWGKGITGSSDANNNTPNDQKTCASSLASGMAIPSVYLLDVSVNIRDQPVGYTPPIGPAVRFEVNYNQRESDQPATFSYSNLGAQWTFNFLAYISDNPSTPDADVNYYTVGGGTLPFTGFDELSRSFAPQIKSHALLNRTSISSYQMLFPDGSSYVFALPDSTSATSRRVLLTSIADPQGNAVQISYDSQFRIVAITDAIGQVTTVSYEDPADILKITKVTDPFGRFASFAYDASHRLSQITDCIGLVSQFTYDSGDDILALNTAYGTTSFAFGQDGRTTWVETTYPDGEKDRVEYSESTDVGAPSQDPASTLPQGMWTRDWIMYARNTYFWDRNAYWAYAANTNDYRSAFIYHWLHDQTLGTAMGVLESVKPALENRIWYNYPGQATNNSGATIIGTSDQPSLIGRVLDDGTTQLRQYSHNALGNITKSIDPVGRSTTYVYASNLVDLLEVRQTTGLNNDLLIKILYNAAHRPISIMDAAGQMTTNTYNARGQLLSSTDPKGEITSLTYDSNGFLLSLTGPLQTPNDTTHFTYDNFGRLRTMTDGEGYMLTYSYDNLDRITNITHPDGTFEAFGYDKLDRVLVQDRLGHKTQYNYDNLRRMVAIQDPLDRVTRLQYCGCGSLSGLIDPLGQQTSWLHDLEGRLIAKVYADGSRVTYNYENTTSRLRSIADEKNQYRVYDYYLDDSLKSVSYPAATVPTPSVTYTYDPNYNRVGTMQDGIGLTTYEYNPVTTPPNLGASRLASINGPLPASLVTYDYDSLGRVVKRAINGIAEIFDFDALGRPASSTNTLGSFHYSYVDATPRLVSEVYPNGQSNSYAYYDNFGDQRLKQVQHFKPGGTLLSSFAYAYNAVGQITAWTNQWDTLPTGVWLPSYDAAYQLTNLVSLGGATTVTNFAYLYDANGNRLSESINKVVNASYYNILNQQVSSSSGLATATYTWDAEDRVQSIIQGANTSAFSYDGLGRRSEIVETSNGSVKSDNRYLWCGDELHEVRDSTGASVLKRFFPQGESVMGATGSTNYFYTRDHLGSIREALSSSGSLVSRYSYDPYGQKSVLEELYPTTFGFAGYYVHNPSGLYLSLFRPYDSATAQWLSRDPVSGSALMVMSSPRSFISERNLPPTFLGSHRPGTFNASEINLYEFALDNPVNFTDSLGLWTYTIGGSFSGQLGPINGNFSGGIAVDGRGNVGWFATPGGGGGIGAGVSGGLSFTGSDAQTICDLEGWFSNVSVGAGAGAAASVEGFWGPSDHGFVTGHGFTVGPGIGAGASAGDSLTVVTPFRWPW